MKQSTCEHCGKVGSGGVMNRWHHSLCRENPNLTKDQLLHVLSKRTLSPEARKKVGESSKLRFQNKEFRELHSMMTKLSMTNEVKDSISNSMKELWNTKSYRDNQVIQIKRGSSSPTALRRNSASSSDVIGAQTKPVNLYCEETNELLAEFVCISSIFDNGNLRNRMHTAARDNSSYCGIRVEYVDRKLYENKLKELYEVNEQFRKLKPKLQKLVQYYLLLHRYGIKYFDFKRSKLHPKLVKLNKYFNKK